MPKQPTPDAPKSQVEKFREAARDLETDDDEQRFDEQLEKIARQKPRKEPEKGG
jgi:hypothetical protein